MSWLRTYALPIAAGVSMLVGLNKYRELSRSRHSLLASGLRLPRAQQQPDETTGSPDPTLFPHFFVNRQGLWLFRTKWLVPDPIGVVFLCHGLGEHIHRYSHVAELLNRHGYSVYGMDHQGHGMSEGDRVFIEDFQHYADDYVDFVRFTQNQMGAKERALPMFLLGHSMGGLISAHVAMESERAGCVPWTGVVLSGPAIQVDPQVVSPTLRKLSGILAKYVPRMRLDKISGDVCSRDERVRSTFTSDYLINKLGSPVKLGYELLRGMDALVGRVDKEFTSPLLILHGTEDKLTTTAGSQWLYDNVASKDKSIDFLDGYFHEIFNDVDKEKPLNAMINWIKQRTTAE
eukprot:TRINITY_DN85715_c0_g1_i1.p1 TRINITY_DN85715_c0_g1~~TRINITY_DN85715_c0_g1_i1.p1  ORF type:complete len:346 (-),score=168.48 TRINITY_DN85715_c0_g1_i1:120-1157(-)